VTKVEFIQLVNKLKDEGTILEMRSKTILRKYPDCDFKTQSIKLITQII